MQLMAKVMLSRSRPDLLGVAAAALCIVALAAAPSRALAAAPKDARATPSGAASSSSAAAPKDAGATPSDGVPAFLKQDTWLDEASAYWRHHFLCQNIDGEVTIPFSTLLVQLKKKLQLQLTDEELDIYASSVIDAEVVLER
nr:unnamed protein product [Digitaria exilis]